MKKISIIIVTYNSELYIKKCLNSIFEYNDVGEFLEVIVADNSNDEISSQLSEIIHEYYPNKVKFIKNDRNGGYGHGNNLGIKHASGKYIAIMNPDIIMTEPLFNYTIEHLERNSEIGLIGYKQRGGLDLSFYFRQEFYLPIFVTLLTKLFNKIGFFKQKYMFLSGAFFFTNKEYFEQIGNFDENIFLYCEESDITNRFLKSGFSIEYDGSKSYLHEIDGREKTSSAGFKYLVDSVLYYLDKFSFSKEKYINRMILDLKFKKLVYYLLCDSKSTLIFEERLKQIYAYKKII